MSRYKISGIYFGDYEIEGMELIDVEDNGSKKLVKIEDVYKLVESGLVIDCEIVKNGTTRYIKSLKCRLGSLPLVDGNKLKFEVTAKISKGGEIIGYKAISNGKEFNLSKSKVWELAMRGNIINVVGYVKDDKKILVGKGMEMRDIREIKIE